MQLREDSTMVLITEFVLSLVLCLIQWRLARAQAAICEPRAFCQASGSCQLVDLNSCFVDSGAERPIRVNYVEGDGNDLRTMCYSFYRARYITCPSPETTSNIVLKDLTLNYVSIDPKFFKVTVSWSLDESSGHRGGYELRLTNSFGITSSCYCLGSSNQTRVTIHNLKYDRLKHLKSVQLLTYPRRSNVFGMSVSQLLRQDIRGCADVQHNGTLCGIRPYPMPRNLTVESSWCGTVTKSMRVKWDHPSVGSDVPLPELYYIYLYSNPYSYIYTQYFTVRHTNEVHLLNLVAAQVYKIYVQAYRNCSGLGDAAENLDCGELAGEIERRVGDCHSINK